MNEKGLKLGTVGRAVRPPDGRAVSDTADTAARRVRVAKALGECLAELQDLGLTLPAALVDNAIAEIR